MNIACVDDDRHVLEQLENLLEQYGQSNNITVNCVCYKDPQLFLHFAKKESYDIVFMDIYFKGKDINGLEAAKQLRQNDPHHVIIFLTSSMDHMREAFAVHAFSYIPKDSLDDQLEAVMDDAVKVLPQVQGLTISKGQQELTIPHHRIVCVYTDGHYLVLRIMDSEPLRIRMAFHELLDQLEGEERFLQINKGVLVNMDHIQSIDEGDCNMVDGTWLPVRHRGRATLVATWRAYQFQKIREE